MSVLVRAGTLLPHAAAKPQRDMGILIEHGIVRRVDAASAFQGQAAHEIHCPGIVMPGFVDAHSHLRGLPLAAHGIAHRPLESWLCSLTAATALPPADEAYLGASQLLDTGVTAVQAIAHVFGDSAAQLAHARAMQEGATRAGIRTLITLAWADRAEYAPIPGAGPWLNVPPADRAAQLHSELPELLRTWLSERAAGSADSADFATRGIGPVAAQWVTAAALQEIAAAASAGVRVHTHLHESVRQRGWVAGEAAPLRRLDEVGLVHSSTSLAHGVDLRPEELTLIASRGAILVHCPSANRRLRVGRAQLSRWIDAGVTAALGLDSDGAPDMFAVMREALVTSRELAALTGARQVHATEVLTMATAGGARALGIPNGGRIVAGAVADMIEIDGGLLRDGENVAASIIAAGTPEQLCTVIVSGVVRRGEGAPPTETAATHTRLSALLDADSHRRQGRATRLAAIVTAVDAVLDEPAVDRFSARLYSAGHAQLGESPRRIEASALPNIVWVDLLDAALLTRSADGESRTLWRSGTPTLSAVVPLATATGDTGGLAALAHDRLIILDTALRPVATLSCDQIPAGHRFSDACAAPDGAIWAGTVPVTSMPDRATDTGRLLRITPAGVTIAVEGIGFANGIGCTRDGSLWFIDSTAGTLLRAQLAGTTLNQITVAHRFDLSPGVAPDGLALDELGRPWVAIFGAGRIERIDLGEPGIGGFATLSRVGATVSVPALGTTACAFDGAGKLLVTTGTAAAQAAELATYPHSGSVFLAPLGLNGEQPWKGVGWC